MVDAARANWDSGDMPLSPAEKQKRYRERQKDEKVTESVTKQAGNAPIVTQSGMTRTDALFEARKPGYYIFEALRSRKCWQCGDNFDTRLDLNKFCSPDCKDNYLKGALNVQKAV